MAVATQSARQTGGFAMNSPLLFGLLNNLSPENFYQVLDVLPASQGIIDYFSDVHCKLYLPGCSRQLYSLAQQQTEPEENPDYDVARLLGLEGTAGTSLDLILLWDLPNYLENGVLRALIEYLSGYTAKRAVLHCYIHTRQTMPAQPGRFSLQADDSLWVEYDDGSCACPLYYQQMLNKLFYPFRVERSILLASGLQEYLFALK